MVDGWVFECTETTSGAHINTSKDARLQNKSKKCKTILPSIGLPTTATTPAPPTPLPLPPTYYTIIITILLIITISSLFLPLPHLLMLSSGASVLLLLLLLSLSTKIFINHHHHGTTTVTWQTSPMSILAVQVPVMIIPIILVMISPLMTFLNSEPPSLLESSYHIISCIYHYLARYAQSCCILD